MIYKKGMETPLPDWQERLSGRMITEQALDVRIAILKGKLASGKLTTEQHLAMEKGEAV